MYDTSDEDDVYTLTDVLKVLKEIGEERRAQIEDLKIDVRSTTPVPASRLDDAEEVKMKQHKLIHSLLVGVRKEKPKDHLFLEAFLGAESPIVLSDLEEEVQNMTRLREQLQRRLSDINKDISYLKNKKSGLVTMRDAAKKAEESLANKDYKREYNAVKEVFKDVQNDLHIVVDTIMEEQDDYVNFLADLIAQYVKNTGDLYIPVPPLVLEFTNFLVEAGVATYHPHDKSKIKLLDLL